MGDTRDKGYQTPVEDNPPHERDDNFSVSEKMTDERRFPRKTGQTAGIGSKVRNFPSQR